ncbi:MAG: HDOD domain-containing protein [Bryobacteraceae bacterium]
MHAFNGLWNTNKERRELRIILPSPEPARPEVKNPPLAETHFTVSHAGSRNLGPMAKLTPFAPVAVNLMRLFDRPDVPIHEVTGLIASDPTLTSEMLVFANSPLFGFRARVNGLTHAVAILGIDRIQSIVAALAVRSLLKGAPKTPVMRRIWRHSVATAGIAEALAPAYGVAPSAAGTAAILHDLGRVGLLAAYSEAYTRLAIQSHENPAAILAAERAEFGMDHCQAGALLAQAWRFPEEFRVVTARHREDPAGTLDVLSLVQTACRLAESYNFAAIAHGDHQKTADTLAACVPEAIRPAAEKLLTGIEERIAIRIESLDF